MNKEERAVSKILLNNAVHRDLDDLAKRAVVETKAHGTKRVYDVNIVRDPAAVGLRTHTYWEKYGGKSYPRNSHTVDVHLKRQGTRVSITTKTGTVKYRLEPVHYLVKRINTLQSGRYPRYMFRKERASGEVSYGYVSRDGHVLGRDALIVNDTDTQPVYLETHEGRVWPLRFVGKTIPSSDNYEAVLPSSVWRLFNKIAQRNDWRVGFDRPLGFYWQDDRDEKYHIHAHDYSRLAMQAIHAKAAFESRAREHKFRQEQTAKLLATAWKTIVTVQDSLDSGNCEPGTREFITRIGRKYFRGWRPTMLPADVLLTICPDAFVMRAYQQAAERELAEGLIHEADAARGRWFGYTQRLR